MQRLRFPEGQSMLKTVLQMQVARCDERARNGPPIKLAGLFQVDAIQTGK